jgi:hypothetical protein
MVRVAIDNVGSTEPSIAPALRRFSPVRNGHSRRVPVLYAGADLACALGETVFHDLPDDAAVPAEVFRADLLTLRASTVAPDVALELADLTDAALASYGHARSDVIDTPPDAYPVTGRWGQHVWNTTTCAGVVWNSRRSSDRLSFMLFVGAPRAADRARAVDRLRLQVVRPALPLYEGAGLTAVMDAASERNVTVIV